MAEMRKAVITVVAPDDGLLEPMLSKIIETLLINAKATFEIDVCNADSPEA